MTATSTVTTRELIVRINRWLKNYDEKLVQSPDGRWCVVSPHDSTVIPWAAPTVVRASPEALSRDGSVTRTVNCRRSQ
jgi:hypothetical protein